MNSYERNKKPIDTREAFKRNIRVYVQSIPTQHSRKDLSRLQQELRGNVSHGKATYITRMHLTVMHLGKPQELLENIRRHNSEVTENAFIDALDEFVVNTQDVIPHGYSLPVYGLDWFGSRRDVLVLQLESDQRFTDAHDRAAEVVHRFLGACGIKDTKAYAYSDSNLRNTDKLYPHITLFRSASVADSLGTVSLPSEVRLHSTTAYNPLDID